MILIFPVPVMSLPLRSKSPPSCGVLSLATVTSVRLRLVNATSSTISLADAPVANVTVVPFVAVNSVVSSLEPFRYTSRYPTV